jgi:aspartate kinase
MDAIRRRRIAPLIMAASASSLLLAIDAQLLGDARSLREELSRAGHISLNENKAIISLVGEGLISDRTSARRALSATCDSGIAALLYGSSPIAIHLITEDSHVEELVAKLHEAFFQDLDPEVFQ